MNTSVNLCGVTLKNPVTVASGTFGSGMEFADFVDLNKIDIHRKKKLGAIAGAGVTILFMLATIAGNIWILANDPTYPIGIFLFVLILSMIVLGGVLVVVVKRIKEIERGEEDEAAKY